MQLHTRTATARHQTCQRPQHTNKTIQNIKIRMNNTVERHPLDGTLRSAGSGPPTTAETGVPPGCQPVLLTHLRKHMRTQSTKVLSGDLATAWGQIATQTNYEKVLRAVVLLLGQGGHLKGRSTALACQAVWHSTVAPLLKNDSLTDPLTRLAHTRPKMQSIDPQQASICNPPGSRLFIVCGRSVEGENTRSWRAKQRHACKQGLRQVLLLQRPRSRRHLRPLGRSRTSSS